MLPGVLHSVQVVEHPPLGLAHVPLGMKTRYNLGPRGHEGHAVMKARCYDGDQEDAKREFLTLSSSDSQRKDMSKEQTLVVWAVGTVM